MDEGDMAQEGYGSEFYGTVMLVLLTATAIPIVVAVVYKTPVERALQFLQGVAKDLPETEAAAEADAVADAERVSEPEPAQEQESEPEPEPEPEPEKNDTDLEMQSEATIDGSAAAVTTKLSTDTLAEEQLVPAGASIPDTGSSAVSLENVEVDPASLSESDHNLSLSVDSHTIQRSSFQPVRSW